MKTYARSLFSGIGILLALAAPLYAQEAAKPEPTIAGKVEKVVATIDADGVQRVAILGGGYFYKPNYVVVKVNVPVEFSLTKESGFTPHDFVIKAPEAGVDIKVSLDTKPQVVKFTATKPGKYAIACSKKAPFSKSHKDKGMEGILEVTE